MPSRQNPRDCLSADATASAGLTYGLPIATASVVSRYFREGYASPLSWGVIAPSWQKEDSFGKPISYGQ